MFINQLSLTRPAPVQLHFTYEALPYKVMPQLIEASLA